MAADTVQSVTVSQLTGRIRSVLEFDFKDVLVEGEVSAYKHHSSGHRYFVLKDSAASLNCTLWRHRRTAFTPQDGMKVVVRGSISVYEPRGQYQLDVTDIKPLGEGELQIAFERLKRRLADEGIFDTSHKKALPEYPTTVGVITSKTGAALHDIVTTMRKRNAGMKIVLRSASVQGERAAADIARAIEDFNQWEKADVIIVGRGGGSIEDLWAFNEEVVARAIYNSRLPIVSAVGHEIDFTIADFVADARAATPTAAVELVVPDRIQLLSRVSRTYTYIAGHGSQALRDIRRRIENAIESAAFTEPAHLANRFTQTRDECERRLRTAMAHRIAIERQRMDNLDRALNTLHPKAPLKRGYAIVRSRGSIIAQAAKLLPGDDIAIEFADASRDAMITS